MDSVAREMQREKREEDRRKQKKAGVEQMVLLCRGEMVGGSGRKERHTAWKLAAGVGERWWRTEPGGAGPKLRGEAAGSKVTRGDERKD